MEHVPICSIVVDRAKRQRQFLDEEIQSLADNIARRGLLNPIIVEPMRLPEVAEDKYLLIAGERRLEAMRRLGWVHIPARQLSDLSPSERTLIEWAENVHRKDLTWQDRARTIHSFHTSMTEQEPGWTHARSGEELGLSKAYINLNCIIWKAAKKNPTLLECTSWIQAYNAIERKFSRSLGAVLASAFELADTMPEFLLEDATAYAVREATNPNADPDASRDMTALKISPEPALVVQPTTKRTHWEINEGNFADWAEAYRGPPFNVIHCDFPYGVEFTNTGIFRKANALDEFYSDEESDFWHLCTVLRSHWEKLVARDAHLIFWFSLNFHREAEDFFNHSVRDELGIKLYVDPFYLMWFKSDNKGMMHDAKHKPRRVYETAFLITVGDQHLCRPGSNVYAGPTAADKHPSAKPLSLPSRHFLRMVVDDTTRYSIPPVDTAPQYPRPLNWGPAPLTGSSWTQPMWPAPDWK
jgi:ParB/RepB/Spo0J family partition protein